jgi:hypothetical protein
MERFVAGIDVQRVSAARRMEVRRRLAGQVPRVGAIRRDAIAGGTQATGERTWRLLGGCDVFASLRFLETVPAYSSRYRFPFLAIPNKDLCSL